MTISLKLWRPKYQINDIRLVTAIAVQGGLLFGCDISSISAFMGERAYQEYFRYPTPLVQGAITAVMAGGALPGALIGGAFGDWAGRRSSIMAATVPWMVGCVVCALADSVPVLILGRIFKGIGVGWTSSQVPSYLSEQSPKNIRGTIVGCWQLAITIGILAQFGVSYGLSTIHKEASFKIAWGLQFIPGFLLLIGMWFCPESCRWLASQGRWEDSKAVIARLNTKNKDKEKVVRDSEHEIRQAVEAEKAASNFKFIHLFQSKLLSRTIAGISVQVWSQLCGMNVMMYYVVVMFQMAGVTGNTNVTASLITYSINLGVTPFAIYFIDKIGRRKSLIIGAVGMCVCLSITAILMSVFGHAVESVDENADIKYTVVGPASKAIIAATCIFVAFFASTWGPVSWVYVSEIFPSQARSTAMGVCTATNWSFNFALAFFVPIGFRNIQWRIYIIFAVFCAFSFVQVFFTFHETKGKSLEEITLLFESGASPFRSSRHEERATDSNPEMMIARQVQHKGAEGTEPVLSQRHVSTDTTSTSPSFSHAQPQALVETV